MGAVYVHERDFKSASFAVLSPCEEYRYWLHRRWNSGDGLLLWVMLNPSTADASVSDPTLRRVVNFSQSEGYQMAAVVNLYAFRATEPARLLECDDPVGALNDDYIRYGAQIARRIVCAWGGYKMASARVPDVLSILRGAGKPLLCLGRSLKGSPNHPLYVPSGRAFERF